jgi:hypothetical protein
MASMSPSGGGGRTAGSFRDFVHDFVVFMFCEQAPIVNKVLS